MPCKSSKDEALCRQTTIDCVECLLLATQGLHWIDRCRPHRIPGAPPTRLFHNAWLRIVTRVPGFSSSGANPRPNSGCKPSAENRFQETTKTNCLNRRERIDQGESLAAQHGLLCCLSNLNSRTITPEIRSQFSASRFRRLRPAAVIE